MSKTHPVSASEWCGYTVIIDGEEQPCMRPATGMRWYQDAAHEDVLDVACELHENGGGRRIAQAEADLARERRSHAITAEALAKASAAEGELRQWRSMRQTFVDVAAYALFHGQHDGASPSDRERILDLVVRVSDFTREHKEQTSE